MTAGQGDLFGSAGGGDAAGPQGPAGFRYRADVIAREAAEALVTELARLPFAPFQFHGYEGKRRVVSFGWRYDFASSRLDRVEDMPAFLREVRAVAADFAGFEPGRLQQVLVTEYQPGAGIGWHRDKAVFGEVVGLSFGAPCVLRLRRAVGSRWERARQVLEPRSAYLLSGTVRRDWEHSVPPVEQLRYSITFRNLREN